MPESTELVRLLTASLTAKLKTLPFRVESYPAVPPKPKTSRFDNWNSPPPTALATISEVDTSTTFKLTLA